MITADPKQHDEDLPRQTHGDDARKQPAGPRPRQTYEIVEALNGLPGFTGLFGASGREGRRPRVLAGREAEAGVDVNEVYARALAARPRPARSRQFVRKHEWVGRVEEVRDDVFLASLTDVTRAGDPNAIEEVGEIFVEEISPGDRAHLRPGATFYWVIGYVDEPHGQRLSRSQFIFRRPLALDEDELAAASERAESMWESLRTLADANPAE